MEKIRKNNFPKFVLLCAVLCIGCQPSKSDKNSNTIIQDAASDKLENRNTPNMEVKISVNPEIYSLAENEININCRLTNNSSSAVQFGSAFTIEKQSDTAWTEEPFIDTMGFEDILYSVEPKESKDFQIPLTKLLKNKNLPPGTYRISKKVWLVDQKKDSLQIFGQFELK
ncbi:immunoglobulin-like domain-containing protein [Chryseobacterium elymi]|nr:immunoglobulin-like domain-containing protein [Chryseobacterium elymi]